MLTADICPAFADQGSHTRRTGCVRKIAVAPCKPLQDGTSRVFSCPAVQRPLRNGVGQ